MKIAGFTALLRALADQIDSGDSLEGRIRYAVGVRPDEVLVDIMVRQGNRNGQGSWLCHDEIKEVADLRRLRDGRAALDARRDLSAMTLAELRELRHVLFDGAVAMQSLDDLGSEQANDTAWSDLREIEDRLRAVDAEMRTHHERE